MFGRMAVKKEDIVCSVCNGTIPNGCSCYNGMWVKKIDSDEWEWHEQEQKVWAAEHGTNVKVRFPNE